MVCTRWALYRAIATSCGCPTSRESRTTVFWSRAPHWRGGDKHRATGAHTTDAANHSPNAKQHESGAEHSAPASGPRAINGAERRSPASSFGDNPTSQDVCHCDSESRNRGHHTSSGAIAYPDGL